MILFSAGLSYAQQQGLYTNFFLHQYLYNPAYIGTVDGQQYTLGYRNQWLGFDGAPTTALASGYASLKKKPKVALGGLILTEHLGLIEFTSFQGMYSYHLKLNEKAAINFGLGAGAAQYNVKAYNAQPYDQDDDFLKSEWLTAYAFDASAGLYFYSKNFFFGFSEQHLTNSKIQWTNSMGRMVPCYYAYTGYNFRFGKAKEWVVQPTVLLRKSSPAPYQLEINLRTTYKDFVWVALNYRHKTTSSVILGFTVSKQFTLAYGYDFALTELTNYSSGTHELLLSYYIPSKKKRSKSEQVGDADENELNTIDNSIKTSIKNKKDSEEKTESKPDAPEKIKEPEQEKTNEPDKIKEPENK